MAIQWGGWEYSGGNGMRVGIDVSWGTPSHGSSTVTATVDIYTENQFTYGDGQTLNFGGAIGGSSSFTNNDGGAQIRRATKTYTYTYQSDDYGSSPGDRTFTASLSGAYNGVTPSKSVTSAIPTRPIGAPLGPQDATAARVSDTSTRVTWTNRDSNANPWDSIILQRSVDGGTTWANISTSISGGASSYTDSSTAANQDYTYRVASKNSIDTSSYNWSNTIFTTPAAPGGGPSNTAGTGTQRVVGWSNSGLNYTQYLTEIWVSRDGGATWAQVGADQASGATSYTDTAALASQKTGYKFRRKTNSGSQGTLYSGFSPVSDFTPGTTTPPLVSTNLQPSGLTVDPTLPMRLTWTFQPGQVGDTQAAFTVMYRTVGTTTWTTATGTTSQFYDIPANTYAESVQVEWTVLTKGADPTYSPQPPSATFTTAVAAVAPDPVKLPVVMDLFTGQLEASSTAYEVRDYLMRAQSQLMGGGTKAVDASYNVSWSAAFAAIGFGGSDNTFPNARHDIVNPVGNAVTNKSLNANVATLTIGSHKFRIGDRITVTGVDSTFNSTVGAEWVVRSVTPTSVSFDRIAANVASTAASGSVSPTILGHGGVANSIPVSGKIALTDYRALYYELPLAWGAGTTPRKNGVLTITQTSLTSNVATFTATGPCYYAIGDRIIISGCGAPYDGERTITGVTSANSGSATFTASITNANIASANPVGALAKPSGKDTFTANFHLVDTSSQFTIPGTWVLLAVKNGATANVEWVTGDVVASASDSDSLQQLTLTSTVDVNGSAGNKPPLRIGAILGTHLRLDGNEIQAMAGDATTGSLILNQSGGNVTVGQGATAQVFINDNGSGGASYINRQSGSNVFIGKSGGSQVVHAYGQLWSDDIATSASAANVFVGSGGRFWQSTSARKNKREIKDLVLTVEQILSLRPVQYKSRTPEDGETVYAGFIADEAEELGLDFWVDHDDEGEVRGFHYGQWTAAQQVVLRAQQDRINDLEERLARIEAHFGDGPV